MNIPWTTISTPSVKTPAILDFSTPAREVVEVLVKKFNEFRRTFEGFSSTAVEIESTNSQKMNLPDEEMQAHAGDSSLLLDSQGSSTKSAFEKPPMQDIPQKKAKTGAEESTSTSCIYLLLFSALFSNQFP